METHSSVLAWSIPGMGEPGGLLSMGLHRVGHEGSDLAATAVHETIHPKASCEGIYRREDMSNIMAKIMKSD